MKVVFDNLFYTVYSSDPASEPGRMESIVAALPTDADIISPEPATEAQLALAHTPDHIQDVKRDGVFDIAAMAAGGAISAARNGLTDPCFGLIRPPGHHASAGSAWGFCYFNNMAVALLTLRSEQLIETAFVLDFDLHYGDGTDHILGGEDWVTVLNPSKSKREAYLREVGDALAAVSVDIIGVSAGFDNHRQDWGGLLATEDYYMMGKLVRQAARACKAGCFGLLEGGYNHQVLGANVAAFINGMAAGSMAAQGMVTEPETGDKDA
jgi:acetoin utilization deacetylase AcuC-like enzyme